MDETPELNRQNLGVLVDDIRSEAGPGEATKRYNQAFIQTFRENGGQMPNDLDKYPWMLLTTTGAKSGKQRTVPVDVLSNATAGSSSLPRKVEPSLTPPGTTTWWRIPKSWPNTAEAYDACAPNGGRGGPFRSGTRRRIRMGSRDERNLCWLPGAHRAPHPCRGTALAELAG